MTYVILKFFLQPLVFVCIISAEADTIQKVLKM